MHQFAKNALVVGLVAALAGCSTTPSPSSSQPAAQPSSAAPSATSTSAPTPDNPEASRLVISSTGIEIQADDGSVVSTISYFDPIAPAVEAITALVGSEPAVDTYDGTGAADYVWPGIELGTDGPAIAPTKAEIYVTATGAEANGLQIQTTEGVQVGDDVRPLAEAHPDSTSTSQTLNGERLSVDVAPVPVEPGDTERAFHTGLSANPSDGLIVEIHAPEKNFE